MLKYPDKIDSKFRFVLLSATRAEQLVRGAKPKTESGPGKPSRVAMKEIRRELIDWDYGPAPEPQEEEEPAEETES
ncbi:MAG: DNA-directed RNA polymerase subunit omega [bacterium]|nr:DNA-directed RNA polymerase subunit omega [bacterium]